MKKKLLTLFAFLSVVLFAFFLQFGSTDSFATSWRAFSNEHGTHMYWYGTPNDPKEYIADQQEYASLWMEVNELAKKEFEEKYPSRESNEWVTETYESRGGSWGPKLLEHYANNRLHGLTEGYDSSGETLFKDEYQTGKRVRHKTYDPGTKWKLPNRLSHWFD